METRKVREKGKRRDEKEGVDGTGIDNVIYLPPLARQL
jgi:hypothetical protein